MRNLVIDQLMRMIRDGAAVYGSAAAPIQDRAALEAMSNQQLLAILINTVEFQG